MATYSITFQFQIISVLSVSILRKMLDITVFEGNFKVSIG